MQWHGRDILLWPLAGIVVGIVAGFVGIAGGILQGPLLLEMGGAAVGCCCFDFVHDFLHRLFYFGSILGLWQSRRSLGRLVFLQSGVSPSLARFFYMLLLCDTSVNRWLLSSSGP